MVNFCSAFNCASSSDVRKDLSFHKFPLKDKERLQKWVHAVRRKDFKPSSNSTLCSLHFNETDFYSAVVSGKKMLVKSAVPTVFDFPNHLTPKIKERRILQRGDTTTIAVQNNEDMLSTYETEAKFVDIGVQTKLTGEELEKTLYDLRRDKKILQQKLTRRDKRVSNMREMLNLLKNNHLIGDTVEDIFKNQFDSSLPFALFKNEIANVNNASNHKSYSEEIREFCLTLHFYSPRAYEFIRQRSTLPDPSTIRRWLATKHCNPGILHEVIDYFQYKLKSETSKFLHVKDVALIYDAMSIREGFWPDKSGKVYGYCDLGGIAHTDNEELAKEALVFIISSLNIKFKCPVAYFFINKINATVQSQLVLAVISVLYEAGITVRSLTSDGTTTNLKTYEILGCSLDHANIQSSFPHPDEPLINIYCIVDPCHLMKICRNCMAELSLSHSGNKISFDYVKKLHEIQQIENLKFANKLSSLHIFYKNKKMSVPLAVQVLSSSVADALQFLQSNNNDFEDATATIEFIRIFDRLFDIMNARNSFGKGFKSPMKLSNRFVWEEIFESAKSYILQLKCEEKNIFQHRRKTFALGFLINILSYKNLALDLLTRENEPLLYFLPYKTSQDHAEITFSCIRSAGGWNNNPSALQFKWIIRKMLYRNSVLPSKNANCQDLEDKNESISIGIFSLSYEKSICVDKEVIIEESIDEEVFSYLDDNTFSHYQKNILYYIAGNAANKFIEKFPCSFCEDIILNKDIFSKDHNYSLMPVTDYVCFTHFKNRGKLKFVSMFIFDIILLTEKFYQAYSANIKNNNFKKDILLKVQRQFLDQVKNVNPTHPIIDTCTLELHEMKIVKFISSYYCTLRVHTQCKKLTQQNQGLKSSLRHKLNKIILFNHV